MWWVLLRLFPFLFDIHSLLMISLRIIAPTFLSKLWELQFQSTVDTEAYTEKTFTSKTASSVRHAEALKRNTIWNFHTSSREQAKVNEAFGLHKISLLAISPGVRQGGWDDALSKRNASNVKQKWLYWVAFLAFSQNWFYYRWLARMYDFDKKGEETNHVIHFVFISTDNRSI